MISDPLTTQISVFITAVVALIISKKWLNKDLSAFRVKFELKPWFFIPLLAIIVIDLAFISFHEVTSGYGLVEKLVSCFVAPVTEETLYRGFLIGVFIEKFFRKPGFFKKKNAWLFKLIASGWVLIVSVLFVLAHDPTTVSSFLFYFTRSLIYAAAYLFNKNNLLPAILAHAAHNITMTTAAGF